jgi:hypothetical protein
VLSQQFYCSRSLGRVPVVEQFGFMQVVMRHGSRDLKSQVGSWIDRKGLFWDDNRCDNQDDYFEFNGIDVTDRGLGECARRMISGHEVGTFSLQGVYDNSPLAVQHGLAEEVLGHYHVENVWTYDALLQQAEAATPKPTNWQAAVDALKVKYANLNFVDDIYQQLAPLPFSITVYGRLGELCRVLTEYLASRDVQGHHTAQTNELLTLHFTGEKAWFTDESQTNKDKFKTALTFNNPQINGESCLYPFHGKIKTPQVRMHFQWPILAGRDSIDIVFIGPKITKG